MSTPEQRHRMAQAILNFEARRDRKGHLEVYELPPGDGGGRYEVAGINERYNREVCDQLVAMINAGRYDAAETLATDFIAQDTDRVASWSAIPALEFYFRDCEFNRGFGGAARILQRALRIPDDGAVGSATRSALAAAEQDVPGLLQKLRAAREDYERKVVGRDENSKFWRGLVNRWNKALEAARTFPMVAASHMLATPVALASPNIAASPALAPASPPVLPALRAGMSGERVEA